MSGLLFCLEQLYGGFSRGDSLNLIDSPFSSSGSNPGG